MNTTKEKDRSFSNLDEELAAFLINKTMSGMCETRKCINDEGGLTFQQCKCHTFRLFAIINLVTQLSAMRYSYTNNPTEMQPVFCEVIEWNPEHTFSASRPSAFKAFQVQDFLRILNSSWSRPRGSENGIHRF